MQRTPKKFFYGWVIVGASFVVMALTMGIVTNCASLFVKPLCDDLGISRQAAGWITTIIYAGQLVAALFSGKIFSTVETRVVMKFCSIGLAVGLLCYSFASQLWQFYLISALLGICLGWGHMVPLSMILGNWFHEKQGLALGTAFMGSGVGGMLFNSLTGVLLEAWGWRTTYQIHAALIFFLLVPIVFFVLRTRPEDMGLEPLGGYPQANPQTGVQPQVGWTLGQILKRPSFWAFCGIALISEIAMNGLMLNVSPHISESGYSTSFAANISALCMGSLALGKFLLGEFYDRMGPKRATVWPYVCTIIGLFGAALARYPVALVPMVCCCGIGGAYGSVGFPILIRSYYGSKDYGSIYGLVIAVLRLGDMITPVFMGAVFDTMGTYVPAYWLMLAATLVVGVGCILNLQRLEKQMPALEAQTAAEQ